MLQRSKSGEIDFAQTLQQVVVTRNRRGMIVWRLRVDARRQRLDDIIGAEMQEKRHRVSRAIRRFASRIYHPVLGRAQLAIGQSFKHIAYIAYNSFRINFYRDPFIIFV